MSTFAGERVEFSLNARGPHLVVIRGGIGIC